MIKKKIDNVYCFEIDPKELNGLIYYNPFEFKLYFIAVPATEECFSVFARLVARNNICVNSKVISFMGTSDVEKIQQTLEKFLVSEIFDLEKLVQKYEERSKKLNNTRQ